MIYEFYLDYWNEMSYDESQQQLHTDLTLIRKDKYEQEDKIVFHHTSDIYVNEGKMGLVLRNIQSTLNEVDISNSFVLIKSTNKNIELEMGLLSKVSTDPVPIEFEYLEGDFKYQRLTEHPSSKKDAYTYDSVNPLKISLDEISNKEKFLLSESKRFCIYPWIHMHAWPTGQAFPCCMSEHNGQIGNCRDNTLEEIWNGEEMKQLRVNMLNEKESNACTRCYEQEEFGFYSGRKSANKHHGHHIEKILETEEDGTYKDFNLVYWDIRFSNLCNLKCRSCGHIFSSQWYKDQAALAGEEWAKNNKPKNYAGRFETDMLEQLLEHLDYVEQVYFAGGEPLVMEEHYIILDELIKRGRTDIRLTYNTNFTKVNLKDKRVFDQWKHFSNVAVGASLDAMEGHAEYIRSGTKWNDVEKNRKQMIEECPHVDFYISATLSIMNALHVTKFHKDWVNKGLIRHQDFNVNIVLDPNHYRIDIANKEYKEKIKKDFQEHIEWLKPYDKLKRAITGYESAMNMLETDNTQLLPIFWEKTNQLDEIRKENVFDYIPELKDLSKS